MVERTAPERWEYLVETLDPYDTFKPMLSQRGREGWELVSTIPPNPRSGYIEFIFKRRL